MDPHQLAWGGGINNVPSNENFVRNLLNRHYHNKLADEPIDVQAISSRATVASGVISLPITGMVDRTHIKALRLMVKKNPPTLPQTRERACIVRIALAERNEAYVSLIRDTIPPNSQEALDAWIE